MSAIAKLGLVVSLIDHESLRVIFYLVGYAMMMRRHADVGWISLFRAMNWGFSDQQFLGGKRGSDTIPMSGIFNDDERPR